jgi:hypothetical protein
LLLRACTPDSSSTADPKVSTIEIIAPLDSIVFNLKKEDKLFIV